MCLWSIGSTTKSLVSHRDRYPVSIACLIEPWPKTPILTYVHGVLSLFRIMIVEPLTIHKQNT